MSFINKTLALGAVMVSFWAVGSQAMAEEYTVKMVTNLDADQVYYFEPAEITIQTGDTIKWVNVQEDMHNAVADAVPKGAEFFESPMLEEEGANWSYTFNKAGSYSYHCHPHAAAGMKGMITVGAPSAPEEMQGGAHNHDHGSHDHGSSHSDQKAHSGKGAMGEGIIHSVSRLNRQINMTHEPIPALNWPEMTMDLDVAEDVDLKALAPDQKIKFHIELGDDKVYRITKIMKSVSHETKQCEPGMDCPMHEGMKHGGDHGDGHGGHDH